MQLFKVNDKQKKKNQNKKQTSIYNVNVVKLCKSLVYKNYFVQYEKVS